jgi:hypothetical protein
MSKALYNLVGFETKIFCSMLHLFCSGDSGWQRVDHFVDRFVDHFVGHFVGHSVERFR